jgi:hypothetical protein
MISILDLPPELIDMIFSHFQGPEEQGPEISPVPGLRGRKRARIGSAEVVCSCINNDRMMGQLLSCAGHDLEEHGRDVVRFARSHSYIMDCVLQSGRCEMVDAWATHHGVIPSLTTTIPSAVR